MNSDSATLFRHPRTWLIWVGAAMICILVAWLAFRLQLGVQLGQSRLQANQRLDVLAQSLETTLSRHESLPSLLALDPALTAALREPRDGKRIAAANAYLEAAQQGAQVAATFLLDARGDTLAASNWRLPGSFVGHNYAFRPYFLDALRHGLGRFYGIGATTGEPGYFIAVPVRAREEILGVVVLKISLSAIEHALAGDGAPLLLADADGIVFLASQRQWRYRSLAPLSAAVEARLIATRQYGDQPIASLADRPLLPLPEGPVRLALAGEPVRERLIHAQPVGNAGWRLVQLPDPAKARETAWITAWGGGIAAAFLLGLASHFRQRVLRRGELRRVYGELQRRQAAKLVVLGQMSAGISHELNQPLAALRTLADNARILMERGRHAEAADNLVTIIDLIERASRIVRQLKIFAHKDEGAPQPIEIGQSLERALTVVEPGRREIDATIRVISPGDTPRVRVDAVRLEQVLVNLIRNGLDAMRGVPEPRLDIEVRSDRTRVDIVVRDHGPGLSEEAKQHLFEPFFTTKPAGEGLGLGLVLSLAIAESHGGSLSARNAEAGGAVFVLTLPVDKERTDD